MTRESDSNKNPEKRPPSDEADSRSSVFDVTRISRRDDDSDEGSDNGGHSDASLSELPPSIPGVPEGDTVTPSQPQKVGRYRIVRLLGEGGFGSVYLAEDETLRRHVAIKVPRLGANAKRLEKEFLTEARQLAQLNHPGIVSVFDIGRDDDRCFIVSDFLSGPSLSQWLKKNKPDWLTSAQICLKIADALAHAHSHRTVHRDLKPSNIILTDNSQPVIVDFGLAVSDNQRAEGTAPGEVSGTPTYMSPEQAMGQGHRIDGRTDIYSLGAILYRLLTGRTPFRSESMMELLRQVAEDEPQPPRQLARHIPPPLEQICLKAMEKSLRERYTTADDMVADLKRVLNIGPEAAIGVSPSAVAVAEKPPEPTFIGSESHEQPSVPSASDGTIDLHLKPKSPGHATTAVEVKQQPDLKPDEHEDASDSESFSRQSILDDSESLPPGSTNRPLSTSVRKQESQRRRVTIINCGCDVYDNDEILESLDSEEQAALLAQFQEYCTEISGEFQGTVLQTTDEGVAVCFGFPVAFEDAVRRSVRFGLAIRDRMDRVNRNWKRQRITLSARVTLHTDHAIAEANMLDDQTSSVSIVGAIRNVASRLADYADPGTVVVSQQTWSLCRDLFEFESLGKQKVRGLPGKVELHEALSEHDRDDGFDGTVEKNLTPLIGRDRETELLQERWEQACEGMGQVVLVIGEAGLGKSRLVHAIKRHAQNQASGSEISPVVEWRASAERQNSSLFPAVEFFERHLHFEYGDDNDSRLQKLIAHLEQLELDGEEEIALFGGMLSLQLPEKYDLNQAPQVRKENLLQLLLDWLRELSFRQPVLFVIEDLHWVDPSTLEFLELLVNQGFNDRILTLFTFRPEFETPWGSKAHQTNLALNRLTRRQVEELMTARAGQPFPKNVVDQIIERTEGVPLFVEEFTKLMMEAGEPDASVDESSASALQQIPASLNDMLMSKLDRIEADIEVMQLGATIGRGINAFQRATRF